MTVDAAAAAVAEIPGWFPWTDQRVFAHFLAVPDDEPAGDLVELGTFMGKSAAFSDFFLREGERFVALDLFESPADDEANERENQNSYSTLDQAAFERYFLTARPSLPTVVQGLSSTILDHVAPGSARFVHVDASHNYDHVCVDVQSSRVMLRDGGVVVFDDIRSPHTPGVAAAAWSAVARGEVSPLVLTPNKLYCASGTDRVLRERRDAWLEASPELESDRHAIGDAELVRVWPANAATTATAPPVAAPPAPESDVELLRRLNRRLRRVEKKVDRLGERSLNPLRRLRSR